MQMEGDNKTGVKGTGYEGEDWIRLAQNKVEWQPIMNKIISIPVLSKVEIFLKTE
jgi:hypothetical protein